MALIKSILHHCARLRLAGFAQLTLFAALTAYLLIALAFAALYSLVFDLDSQSFRLPGRIGNGYMSWRPKFLQFLGKAKRARKNDQPLSFH